jgi:hypothetical protein
MVFKETHEWGKSLMNKSLIYTAAAMSLLVVPVCSACTVCYGSGPGETSMVKGVGLFVGFLLGTTALVLGGILFFVFYLRKMARLDSERTSHHSDASRSQHSPLWHLQQAHAASGTQNVSEFGFLNIKRRHRRSFFKGDRGSLT